MKKNNPKGVRKGAWSKEEDILLKNCVEKYGEGKWHLLPVRAGLNRCRKSCRLRWLNYLRPNIKRGKFSKDEIDLIIRLQKLLGNRWSLIAGRLPGRTANDVKNLWNTRLEKKNSAGDDHSVGEDRKGQEIIQKKITKSNIIRPRPWTFSKDCPRIGIGSGLVKNANINYDHDQQQSSSVPNIQDECSIRNWWSDLLESSIGLAKGRKQIMPYSNDDADNSNNPRKDYIVKQKNNPVGLDGGDNYCTTPNINGFSNGIDQADYNGVNHVGLNDDNPISIQKGLTEFPFDCDIWELLDSNDRK